jgi:hypothetical protein
VTPYYERDGITVYCARWEDVHAAGLIPVRDVALVHADPPYGTRRDFNRGGEVGVKRKRRAGAPPISVPAGRVREFAPCLGDDAPFDPAPLLALKRPLVTWGANHYASRLPDSSAGIFWDKRDDVLAPPDDGSDGEYAWSNIGGSIRTFRHYWRGAIRKTEKLDAHLHVNQKPIALSTYVFREHAKLKPGALVLVPYGGSGPDIAAALAMGLRLIWCEAIEEHCRAAVGARLHASPSSPLDALPLFAPRPTP